MFKRQCITLEIDNMLLEVILSGATKMIFQYRLQEEFVDYNKPNL